MKKLLTLLLAVCLLASLAIPVAAAKVDLSAIAQDAINELAKYNSTPVGEKFNVKTMMGYVFGDLCADNTYLVTGDNRFERYKIPATACEEAFRAAFAAPQEAFSYMAELVLDDFSFEYTNVQKNVLDVYDGSNYYFSKYHLNRTEVVAGHPKKSGSGFVVETAVPTWTVNGYVSAGNYTYKVYATNNSGNVVEYTIKWAGADVQFVSTKAASVPGNVVKPGTQAELATTTTKKPTTTTTQKPTAPNGIVSPTTGTPIATQPDDGTIDLGDPTDTVGTTTANQAGSVVTRPQTDAENTDGATEEQEDSTAVYVLIAVVLGLVVLAVIIVIVLVLVKQKKKAQ